MRGHTVLEQDYKLSVTGAAAPGLDRNKSNRFSNDSLVFAGQRPAWTYACLWYLSVHQVDAWWVAKRRNV